MDCSSYISTGKSADLSQTTKSLNPQSDVKFYALLSKCWGLCVDYHETDRPVRQILSELHRYLQELFSRTPSFSNSHS